MSNFYAEAVKAAKAHFSSAHDQQIFLRQMKQEAGFTDATSPAGAQGPAQIMPATARGWGVKNVHDPREAYNAAARNMAKYLRSYGGDWAKALTAYNAGPAAVGGKLPAETIHYINTILGGSNAKAGKTVTDIARGKAGGGVSITPGRTTQDVAGAFTDALLNRGPVKGSLKHSLLKDVSYRLSTGQYDSTSAPTVKTTTDVAKAAASGAKASGDVVKGVANFDGKKVAGWIAPILQYARQHGWKGTVNSGYRSDAEQTRIYNSGVRPAAKPKSLGGGGSNHSGTVFPLGAIDVSEAQQLSNILAASPFAGKLQWAGAKDPVHFSHPHGGSY